jgi:bacterial/archaeal transporter family protein
MNWIFYALLSALFAGLTAVLAKLGVAHLHSNLATAIRSALILILTTLIASATFQSGDLSAITRRTWLLLAASAITTGLSWLCYFRALQLGPVSKVAPLDKLSLLIAIALSCLFLGEKLTTRESLGASLLTLGALLLAWK